MKGETFQSCRPGIALATGRCMDTKNSKEASKSVKQAQEKLHKLLTHFREDSVKLESPQASALFETTAEVLAGLERAFKHYAAGSENAWRR